MRRRFAGMALVLVCAFAASSCTTDGDDPVPEEVMQHNILGTAFLGQQKWAEAEEQFAAAHALRARDPLPLNNLAVSLMQQGRLEEATARLEEALAVDPDFPHAHFNLGLIAKNEGEFARARDHFTAVARQDPDDLLTQYNLGLVLGRTDDTAGAEAAFRRALEMNPAHVSSLYGLGRLLLQRGDTVEGARLVELSQEIRARSGLDEAVGTQYGEQGPYAMGADYPGDALEAPPSIDATFVAETTVAAESSAFAVAQIGDAAGPTLFVAGERRLETWNVAGPRVEVASFLPSDATALDLEAGDLDGDGDADLAILLHHGDELLFGWFRQEPRDGGAVRLEWGGEGLRPAAPTGAGERHADLTLVDRDHDGDLDAFWCATGDGSAATCRIATNDGAGGLTIRESEDHGFSPGQPAIGPLQVGFSDIDNDRDVDLLWLEPGGLHVYTNQRDDTFHDISDSVGLGAAVTGAIAFRVVDLDKDGWMDLVVSGSDATLWRNGRGRFAATDTLSRLGGDGPAIVVDYDNDGLLDLARGGSRVELFRNRGRGRFSPAPDVDGLPDRQTPVDAFDADGDGDADLLTWSDADGFRLLRNDGGNANHWIAIRSRGVGDNAFGVGAKIEVLAGGLRQKYEVTDSRPLLVGLGDRRSVESVRYLWPSGVLQDEVRQDGNQLVEIEQLDRKGTSCPLLYAWDGDGWRFVTDFLGGAAIGYQQAPGRFNTPDTDEVVRIDGGLAPDRDGRLRLRLNNQLEEVLWFDRAELIVVDHPVGTEVYPNERLMPGPPFPDFALYASADVRPIVAARGDRGQDVTGLLRERDRRTVDDFRNLPFKGYAEDHTLELDLGSLPTGRRVVLLLDGWIDYADSSANVAAHQAGRALRPPVLSVGDGRGGWRAGDGRMGFPAGLTKTMSVDLTDRLTAGDARVRIETNMRIHWDRARVLVGGEDVPMRVERRSARAARLRHGGFPAEARPGERPPIYDPASVEPFRHWKAHVGAYTAHGDVRELLEAIDDRFVTTRNGDEVELVFEAPLPPRAGETRTYLLFADGFGKDMDPNSAAAHTVGPIPFHGMPHYPYGPEVRPPARDVPPDARWVRDHGDGLPGAVPQAYVAAVADAASPVAGGGASSATASADR